jgi:hypothetical protein
MRVNHSETGESGHGFDLGTPLSMARAECFTERVEHARQLIAEGRKYLPGV